MIASLRLIDTGLKPAGWNAAVSQALLGAHRTGHAGDTLRFYRAPPSVLLGRYQRTGSTDALRHDGKVIGVARRVTGGPAAFVTPDVLCFDLVTERACFGLSLSNAIALICTSLAAGIARTGIPTSFQPSGTIVIGNRSVGSVTGTFDGLTLIFQGFVHLSGDGLEIAEHAAARAKVKLGPTFCGPACGSLSVILGRTPLAREIMAVISAKFSDDLKRPLVEAPLSAAELDVVSEHLARSSGFEGHAKGCPTSGAIRIAQKRLSDGIIQVRVTSNDDGKISDIQIAGDFSIAPVGAVDELEHALRGVSAVAAPDYAREILERSDVVMYDVAPVDIAAAIARAVKTRPVRRQPQ